MVICHLFPNETIVRVPQLHPFDHSKSSVSLSAPLRNSISSSVALIASEHWGWDMPPGFGHWKYRQSSRSWCLTWTQASFWHILTVSEREGEKRRGEREDWRETDSLLNWKQSKLQQDKNPIFSARILEKKNFEISLRWDQTTHRCSQGEYNLYGLKQEIRGKILWFHKNALPTKLSIWFLWSWTRMRNRESV